MIKSLPSTDITVVGPYMKPGTPFRGYADSTKSWYDLTLICVIKEHFWMSCLEHSDAPFLVHDLEWPPCEDLSFFVGAHFDFEKWEKENG